MKTTTLTQNLIIAAAFACALSVTATHGADAPKIKMTTEIPPSITTPDQVKTRIGALKFSDGFPDRATVEKCYDNLDFQRGVQAYLTGLLAVSVEGLRRGFAGFPANQTVPGKGWNVISRLYGPLSHGSIRLGGLGRSNSSHKTPGRIPLLTTSQAKTTILIKLNS
jgi:hypothetical protein